MIVKAGLCPGCRFVRRVATRRGAEFLLCRRSIEESRFERYPRQPVGICVGYEEEEAGGSVDDGATADGSEDAGT